MTQSDRLIELTLEFRIQTVMAILVSDGDIEAWISKSLIEEPKDFDDLASGDEVIVIMPEGVALEKELI